MLRAPGFEVPTRAVDLTVYGANQWPLIRVSHELPRWDKDLPLRGSRRGPKLWLRLKPNCNLLM